MDCNHCAKVKASRSLKVRYQTPTCFHAVVTSSFLS